MPAHPRERRTNGKSVYLFCRRCETWKDRRSFGRVTKLHCKCGRHSYCRPCQNAATRLSKAKARGADLTRFAA